MTLREWKSDYQKQHYLDNKERYVSRAIAHKKKMAQKNREFIREYKQTHPCVDCDESDWVVLDFDHVRGEKKKAVGSMVLAGYSLKTIQEEIDKCEIRCANCHRRKTAKELWQT